MKTIKKYYYVKIDGAMRLSHAVGPREACKDAFGVVYDRENQNCYFMCFGTRSPKYIGAVTLSNKVNDPKNWFPMWKEM